MIRHRLLCACTLVLLPWQASQAQSDRVVSDVRPTSSPAKATDTIAKRSLRLSCALVAARPSSQDKQIQVEVRFILLETEARERLYKALKHENVKTAFASMPKSNDLVKLPTSSSDRQSFDTVLIPSQVSTTTLEPDGVRDLLFRETPGATDAEVTLAPKLIVINGLEAEFRHVTQKPFVVGVNYLGGTKGDGREPIVKVCEEGTTIHVRAKIVDSEHIELAARIVSQQISSTQNSVVYGIGPDPSSVQIPVEHLRAVAASEVLRIGHTLLIDPYECVLDQDSETAKGVPILQRLPLVGRKSFKREKTESKRHLIFTMTPSIHLTKQGETTSSTVR